VENELPLLDRPLELPFRLEPLQGGHVHVGAEDLEPALAPRLCRVHGHVGVTKQVGCVQAGVIGHGDP
jgi:hypothetical protein